MSEPRELSEAEKDAMRRIKDAGAELIKVLIAFAPPGREQSLALTKAQESVMWAVNGLTK